MSRHEDIFLKIAGSQRDSTLDDALKNRCEAIVRGEDQTLRRAHFQHHSNDTVTLDFSEPVNFGRGYPVTIHFTCRGEKYFMRGVVSGRRSEEIVTFSFKTDLYRVQRRANFRVALPSGEDHQLELLIKETGEFLGSYEMKDLSAGGCRILFREPFPERIQSGRIFLGRMKIKGTETIELDCDIKHVQKNVSGDPQDKEAGIEFQFSDQKVEHRLLNLAFDLQRRLFGGR